MLQNVSSIDFKKYLVGFSLLSIIMMIKFLERKKIKKTRLQFLNYFKVLYLKNIGIGIIRRLDISDK